MDLNTITVADFKTLFARDFPYLPVWSDTKVYNANAIVYYETNELFYRGKVNGIPAGTLPTDTSKWELVPDQTADDIYNYILDSDIEKAFAEAQVVFNQGLFGTDAQIRLGYLYLTAHYLVNDMRAGLAGIQSTGAFPVSARTVGSVSESYTVPKSYSDDPVLSFYTSSSYGMKYLSMVLPNLVGNVVAVQGWTPPT